MSLFEWSMVSIVALRVLVAVMAEGRERRMGKRIRARLAMLKPKKAPVVEKPQRNAFVEEMQSNAKRIQDLTLENVTLRQAVAKLEAIVDEQRAPHRRGFVGTYNRGVS